MEKQKRISFGYTRNDVNEIVIYEEQADVVKLIFELYSFDQSLAKISSGFFAFWGEMTETKRVAKIGGKSQ